MRNPFRKPIPISKGRKFIQALREFRPGMEVEEERMPLIVLLIAFLALIGSVTVAGAIITAVRWMAQNVFV